jgi:hypothetical protein
VVLVGGVTKVGGACRRTTPASAVMMTMVVVVVIPLTPRRRPFRRNAATATAAVANNTTTASCELIEAASVCPKSTVIATPRDELLQTASMPKLSWLMVDKKVRGWISQQVNVTRVQKNPSHFRQAG